MAKGVLYGPLLGLEIIMKHLSIDIETYSDNDIKYGIAKYVESPNFQILLFAYAWDFDEVHVIDLACGEKIPSNIFFALNDRNAEKGRGGRGGVRL